MSALRSLLMLLLAAPLIGVFGIDVHAADRVPKNIVLIAGPKSHGPEGNRIHDYPWSVKLLEAMLERSNVRDEIKVRYVRDGWPKDPAMLASADAIVVISDGRDGDLFQEAPHLESPERVAEVQKLIDRGCGLVTIHFATFAPDQYAAEVLNWTGAYFDWEEDGQRKWHSAIETQDADVVPVNASHATLRGVAPFHLKEEFYFNLRFAPVGSPAEAMAGTSTPLKTLSGVTTPLLVVPSLPGRDALGQTVAWARERDDGGRGFGTTCGHFYDNWQNDNFRKLVLNAIVWSAHGGVPEKGVEAPFLSRPEICEVLGEPYDKAMAGEPAATPAPSTIPDADRIRVLMFAGNEAHKWHNWEKTTPAIKALLEVDPRIHVDVSYDIEDLAKRLGPDANETHAYDVIVQNNYANWQDPTALSDASKAAFVDFLQSGGGLVLVHFANGAWHFSLPNAGASDWPEYRNIVRRVWNHQGPEATRSAHDSFAQFTATPTSVESPLTNGLGPFEIQDELYFSQQGDQPIEPLLTARSTITKKEEPLAWAYTYGKGRVFQTLLGHSEKTYEVFEPREMLRRAVAWCAGKEIRNLKPADDVALRTVQTEPLVPGKFGSALNAAAGGAFTIADPSLRRPPLTVEAWVKLNSQANFNILVASEEKSSAEHWELYTYAGSGVLSVYLPGHGGEYKSEINVCDGAWHHVAMQLEPALVRLFVDGQPVLDRELGTPFTPPEAPTGPSTVLAVGRLVEDGLGCDGLIDDVRIKRGIAAITADAEQPANADRETRALWRFDAIADGGKFTDEKGKHPATTKRPEITVAAAPAAPAPKKELNHWGKELVGFDWHESDSVDGRWQQTQVGNFLASIVPIDGQPIPKGLSIKVGDTSRGTVCYDTGRGQMRAAWRDGFLKFHPARYGLIESPAPDGVPLFTSQPAQGFSTDSTDARDSANAFHYRGFWRKGARTVLQWNVGGTEVLESPWIETNGDDSYLTRTFEISPGESPLIASLIQRLEGWEEKSQGETQVFASKSGDGTLAISLQMEPQGARLRKTESGAIELLIPPRKETTRVKVIVWNGKPDHLDQLTKFVATTAPPEALQPLATAGPSQWNEEIVTRGVRGADDAPYVIDTITIPFENPYKALFFTTGHDFLTPDAAMVCTVHGDVWLVTGIGDSLERLEWKRFATGLFQPLGMVVRKRVGEAPPEAADAQSSLTSDFDILVLCRDHIARLHDLNADNEADYYEVFHEDIVTSPGGHDYVTCLESDHIGRLYYLNAVEGLIRVSPDGKRKEVMATGFRNPNGLGVGPNGEMTVAPQEGEWTPGSGIFEVRPGGYGGYGGPKVQPGRPLGYDPPLCWIPRRQDNSSGGQVWVASDRWGPLTGKLLHLSFGQCTVQLVLREYVYGQGQGGTYVFPLIFESGICRGRFSPFDGQLYLTGLRGWTTAATQDGCFQRMRYTGQPVHVPTNVTTLANGLMLTFTEPLDRESAENPDNYFAEQWNITYRKEYGSPEFKVSNPKEEGRDPVEIESATLLEDNRTVFLEMGTVQPVSQLVVSYTLKTADGAKMEQTYAHTIHTVREAPFDPAKITRRPRKGQLTADEQARQRPGVCWTMMGSVASPQLIFDASLSRMALLFEEKPGETEAPFHADGSGFLYVPLKGEYRFRVESNGPATFQINGTSLSFKDASEATTAHSVTLHKGYNRFLLTASSPESRPLSVRLLWSSDTFAEEPVPPDALSTLAPLDGASLMLSAAKGEELIRGRHCARCHADLETESASATRGIPSLEGMGDRLNSDWIRAWVLAPRSMRPDATMPSMLTGLNDEARQQAAADLAAYLMTLRDTASEDSPAPSLDEETVERGAALYEDLGCIACHRLTAPDEEDAWNRIPLSQIAAKFTGGRLVDYLKAPGRHFSTTFMPDFRLTDDEAAAIAGFLIDQSKTPLAGVAETVHGDAARGEKLFQSVGCNQCHLKAAGELLPAPFIAGPKNLEDLDPGKGCLASPGVAVDSATSGGRPVPEFAFDNKDRLALREFGRHPATASDTLPHPARESSRLMAALRCSACHDRDGKRSPRMEIIADEGGRGLSPEQFPALTWTGDRLRKDWTERFIAGAIKEKPRQWLKARMPSFPAYAKTLAAGLAAEHGHAGDDPERLAKPDPELAEAGRLLIQGTGLDCRQCHGLGDEPPTGDRRTLLAPGINFAMVKDRMRSDFYHRWMLDPPRFDLNTRMPKLAADGKTTKVTRFFDGDARKQFDAIWAFLQQPEDSPPPQSN